MKRKITLLAILAGLTVTAQNASAQENRRERGGFGRQLPPELLKKYDTDKDGKLSEEEGRKAREDYRKQREPQQAPKAEEKKPEAKAEEKKPE